MKRTWVVAVITGTLVWSTVGLASTHERVTAASEALKDLAGTPDKGIPTDLIAKSQCMVIIPSLKKGAFVVGAEQGKGFAMCRTKGGWSGPAGVKVEGGSVGFQIGGSETEVVMLVMNKKGMDRLLTNQFTLGGDASVAAGPVGRTTTAQTDAAMTAEILSWSRARGVFAGVSLSGATLREDQDTNKDLYGKPLTNREILEGTVKPPASAAVLTSAVRKY
jgi:SH3 domain-containing YSC84-like protein 1